MDYPLSSATLPSSGLMRRGALYPLPTWVPRTSASASSYWPTAAVNQAGITAKRLVDRNGDKPTHWNQRLYDKDTGRVAQKGLDQAIAIWQTPGTDSFRSRGGDRKDEPGLDQQARMWPTPTTNDSKNDAPPSQYERDTPPLNVEAVKWATPRAEHDSGRHRGVADTLHSQTKQWATPTVNGNNNRAGLSPNSGDGLQTQVSRLHQTTEADGPPSSINGPTSRPRLNPAFTDWLMNLVPGWTDCVPLAMPSSCDRQLSPLPSFDTTLESDEECA
jgi:hypothetical protein